MALGLGYCMVHRIGNCYLCAGGLGQYPSDATNQQLWPIQKIQNLISPNLTGELLERAISNQIPTKTNKLLLLLEK